MCFGSETHPRKFYDEFASYAWRSLIMNVFLFANPQLSLFTDWQEWLTVSAYLSLTVFVIWGVFNAQKR